MKKVIFTLENQKWFYDFNNQLFGMKASHLKKSADDIDSIGVASFLEILTESSNKNGFSCDFDILEEALQDKGASPSAIYFRSI